MEETWIQLIASGIKAEPALQESTKKDYAENVAKMRAILPADIIDSSIADFEVAAERARKLMFQHVVDGTIQWHHIQRFSALVHRARKLLPAAAKPRTVTERVSALEAEVDRLRRIVDDLTAHLTAPAQLRLAQ